MATDNTHLPQNDTSSGSDNQEFNPEVVQIAQADADAAATGAQAPAGNGAQPAPIPGVPGGEVQVQIPAGQTVVRVQIAPGETIDLPFDGALAAKFGEQGNLAVKVGDQTIILLGYAEANQQEGVTLKDAKGHAIDVATVIAQTDPNLDIQTAAGPAAGPAGQGGHLFHDFNPGAGLGGFGELNVIDPTQLQYGLIQPDEKLLVVAEEPSIIIISVDNGGIVNEDDFHHNGGTVTEALVIGGDGSGASQGLLDQLAGDGTFTSVQFGNHQNGNDPYDTGDNEDGSQNDPALPDKGSDSNGRPLDQDREPLSATAHIGVKFHNGPGGTLTFDHNGQTPIIENLAALALTSHGHALSYELLPATATHGESIVAYYTQGDSQVVVFSLEIQEPHGAANGNFDITFTIYGTLDNTGQGIGLASFDLSTVFFANADGGLTAESNGALVFHDIDDVPELGHYSYATDNGTDTAVQYHPANLTIGIDETPQTQQTTHTSYQADVGTKDAGDIDPTGALGQHKAQQTDEFQTSLSHINDLIDAGLGGNPAVSGLIGSSYFINGDAAQGFQNYMGAAHTFLDVSFGADGEAEGNSQAGKTIFTNDGNANATAFQLYMQEGAAAPSIGEGVLTNVWIDVDNGDGTFTREQVTAYQLDANTIIGIAPAPEGVQVLPPRDGNAEVDVEGPNGGIPVFALHLDPATGELTMVQYHSVENPDGSNPNDPLQILDADGNQLIHFRATDYDGDHVDAPLEVAIIDDAPVITTVTYNSGGTEDHAQGHVDEDYLPGGNHDHDTSPDNVNNPYSVNDKNDGDGPGHTHVTGQIEVQNGVDTPLIFSFTVPGLDAAHSFLASFNDASGHVVETTAGNAVSLTLSESGNEWIITGADSKTGDTVFTVTLDSLTGSFTFDLQGSLHHPDTGAPGSSYEDDLGLNFGVQVKDSDNDVSTGNLSFVVDDDAPKVNLCVIDCAHVMVDETLGVQKDHGADDQHGPVPSIFSSVTSAPALSWAQSSGAIVSIAGTSYGADGAGTTVMKLHTSVDGVDSGLTTDSGQHIFLYQHGDIVVGKVGDASGPVAFAVALDTSTDQLTVVQYIALHHNDATNPNDIMSVANGALQVTLSVTDGDGDTRSQTVSVGDTVEFRDDAPKVNLCVIDNSHVMVDETLGVQTDHGADDRHGPVPSIFSSVTSAPALSWAQSSGAIVSTAGTSYGVDGPGTTVMKLHTSVDGVDSGLTTDNGQHIFLYQDGDIVVGRVGDASGPVAFAVALTNTTDQMTVVQYIALHHNDATNPNDIMSIANGALQVTLSVTDGDGDTRSQTVSVGGAVEFRDDAPIAHDDYATLDETLPTWLDPDHDSHKVTGNVVLGNSTDLNLFNNSLPDQLSVDHNHTITQMVYGDTTMKIDFATNTVTHTGTDATNIIYNPATGHLSFDTPYGHLDIVVKSGESNDPTLLNAFDKNALGYYEYSGAHNAIDTYYGVHQNGDGSTTLPTGANDAENITQLENSFGDVTLSNNNGDQWSYKEVTVDGKTYAGLGVSGGIDNGEADTNSGHAEQITLTLPTAVNNATVTLGAFFDGDVFDNGHLEVARWEALAADGHVIASGVVTGDHNGLVDIDIQTTENFSSIRLTPLDDGAGNSGDNSDFLIVGVNTCKQVDVNETFNYTLTDADGDSSSANLHVSVNDATPSLIADGSTTNVTVDEDGLPAGNQNNVTTAQGNNDEVGGHNSASEATYAGGVFKYNPGADGFQSLTLNSISDLKTVNGTPIIFAWDEATHQLIGYEAGNTSKVAILVTLDPLNGGTDFSAGFNFTVELKEPLQHPAGGQENDLGLDIQVQVEDKDCDVVVGKIHVTINDDMPTITPASCPNLVQNGSFENLGAEDGGTLDRGNWGVFATIPGWTSGAAVDASKAGIEIQNGAVVTASDGHNYVELDSDSLNPGGQRPADTNAYIAQDVHGTVTGQSYILSFDYQPRVHDAGTNTNDIAVFWNGVQIGTLSGSGSGWEHVSFVVPGGASDTSKLMFMAEGTADTLGGFLDNVSVCGCAVVDEDDLRTSHGASFNGTDQAAESLTVFGQTGVNFGADGAAAFGHGYSNVQASVALTSEGKAIHYSVDNNGVVHGYVVEGNNSHHDVFTINFSGSTFSFTLLDHIDHVPGQGQNIQDITFNFTATDGDGDSANGSFGVKVVDDVPTAAIESTRESVVLDETLGKQSGTDDQNGLPGNPPFHYGTAIVWATESDPVVDANHTVFGADGPAAHNSAVFALHPSADGVDSGLKDTATGQDIYLFQDGDNVVGKVGGANGPIAIALTLDDDGRLTVAEYRAIQHPDSHDPNDSVSITDSALVATVTVTDGDGDSNSASIGIGSQVTIKDDAPTACADNTTAHLTIDESAGQQADDHSGPAPFSASYGTALAWGATTGSVIDTNGSSYGTDGPAASHAKTFSLHIPANGTDSGINDVATGHNIYLYQDGDNIVGRIADGNNHPNPNGAIAFAVTIDSTDGELTVAEYRALQHNLNGSNPDDTISISNDALQAVVTLTDGDGDSDSASVGIGSVIKFQDDAPTVTANDAKVTISVDETPGNQLAGETSPNNALSQNSADVSSLFNVNMGVDLPGKVVYSLTNGGNAFGTTTNHGTDSGLKTTAGGEIYLFQHGTSVEGHVGNNPNGPLAFTASINGSTVTLTQYLSLQHNLNGQDPNDTISLNGKVDVTATATDQDNDHATVTSSSGLNLTFYDDGPSITAKGNTGLLAVDETSGNQVGDTTPAGALSQNTTNIAGLFNTTNYGADGAGTTTYALTAAGGALFSGTLGQGTDSGLKDTATGQHIYLFQNGGVVEGHVGNSPTGPLAFTLSISGSTVTLTEILPIQHPNTGNSNDFVTLNGIVHVTATATDGDGDHVTATDSNGLNLTFYDDGPSISAKGGTASIAVDETPGNQLSGETSPGGNVLSQNTTDVAGLFNTANYGADGPATSSSLTYALTAAGGVSFGSTTGTGTDSGLKTTDGHEIYLFQNGSGEIDGRAGSSLNAPLAFTLTINGSTVTLNQMLALQHNDPSNPNDTATLNGIVHVTVTATDGDGDHTNATDSNGLNLTFYDDGPTITPAAVTDTLSVDETNLNTPSTVVDVANLFTTAFGVDGPAAAPTSSATPLTYVLSTASGVAFDTVAGNGTDSGLKTTDGHEIYLFQNGSHEVDGRVGNNPAGALAFTVTISGSKVTLDQFVALQHSDPANPDDAATLSGIVHVTATITDGDNDQAHVTDANGLSLTFYDDGPTIAANNAQGGVSVDETHLNTPGQSFTLSTLFTTSFGADGPASSSSQTYALTDAGGHAFSSMAGQGVDSGLKTTSGAEIYLFQHGSGEVDGRVGNDPSGTLAFKVWVSVGELELQQMVALRHNNPADPDDAVTLNGIIHVTATATDGDGDHVNATDTNGLNLTFHDDGPTAALAAVADTHVTIDESANNQADDHSGTAPFSAGYGSPLAWGTNGTAVVSTSGSAYGADGAGTTVLGLKPGSAGVDSGLIDTATGQHIYLYQGANDGEVIGRVGSGGAADANGPIAVAISINSDGTLNVAEYSALQHPNTSSANEGVSITDSSLVATVTVTDGDGDTQTATANIGSHASFLDDGPTANSDVGGTGVLNTAITGNVLANDSAGADHVTGFDHGKALSVSITVGQQVFNFNADGQPHVIAGVGSFSMDDKGNWSFTQTGLQGGSDLTVHYTMEDGDHDTATSTLDIPLKTATPPTFTSVEAIVDEDGLANGTNPNLTTAQGNGDVVGGKNSGSEAVWHDSLSDLNWHGDVGTLKLAGTPSNFSNIKDLGGHAVDTVTVSSDGHTLTASAQGVNLVSVTIDNDGNYSVNLLNPIQQPTAGTEDNVTASIGITATNAAGQGFAGLTITINDDTPTATSDALGSYAENSGAHDVGNAKTLLVDSNDHPGADGYQAGSLQIIGAGDKGGSLTIDGVGHLIYTPAASVNNPGGASVTETFTYQYKDGDGDIATAHVTFGVTDTSPTVNVSQAIATVDEDALSGGNPGGTGDHVIDATHNTPTENIWKGQIAFSYGNDTSGASKDIVLSTAASTGLTKLDGTAIQTFWDSSTYTLTGFGTNHADVVFTIVVTNTNTGDYTVTLDQPIKHAAGSNENDASFDVNIQVTDGDGSTANGSLHVVVNDDTPIATNDGNFAVSALNQNSTPEISHDAGSGLLANDHPGADGGSITSVEFKGVHHDFGTADHVTFAVDGGDLTVKSDGSWSYDQTSPVTTAVTDTFTYTLTDGDGDKATATFSIDPFVNQNKPTALGESVTLAPSVSGVSAQNNVLFVLDLSTSMDAIVSGNQSRLQVEQAALVSLLQQYQSQSGSVHIQIETFGVSAATNGHVYSSDGSTGYTLQNAIDYINGFTNGSLTSGTNYDAAIGGTDSQSGSTSSAYSIVNSWGAASSTVSNTVYFISDGLPQSNSGSGNSAGNSYLISAQQQAAWDNLLAAKGAAAYAIGIDLGNSSTAYLQQVAAPNDSSHVITTGSVNLGTVLTSITPVISTATGNVLSNDTDGGDGYHTPAIVSFDHGGHTYAWNGSVFTVDGSTTLGSTVAAHNGTDITIQTQDGGVFELNFTTGVFNYTAPQTSVNETETFTYTIEDNLGNDTSTATLTINVKSSPVITSGATGTEAENTAASHVVYQTTATDPNGHALTYSISGADAALFHIDPTTGAVTFNNAPNFENPQDAGHDNIYNIIVDAHDAVDNTDATKAVAITVTNVNEAPITVDDSVTATKNTALTIAPSTLLANDSDPDGDALTITAVGGASHGTVTLSGGQIHFTPANNYTGPASFTYTASDGHGGTTTGNVAVTVNAPPPQISIGNVTTAEPATGTTTMTFHVTLNTPAGASGLDVDWTTTNGTALAGLDYVAANGTLHINAGANSGDITVTVNSDLLVEGNETFSVVLSNPHNGTIADGSATGTITDTHEATLTVVDMTSVGFDTHTGSGNNTLDGDNTKYFTSASGHTNDHLWVAAGNNNNALTGNNAGDVFYHATADGNHHVYTGGSGNDLFVIQNSDLFDGSNNPQAGAGSSGNIVNGVSGTDTLEFNFNLDTTKLDNTNNTTGQHQGTTLSHLDIVDMTGSNNQSLTLDYNSVTAMADGNKLVVQSANGGTVNLQGIDVSHNWTAVGVAPGSDGTNYVHYTSGSGGAAVNVYIDEHANVAIHNV